MVDRSPLDDPRTAAHAWRRFKRMMRLMALVTALAVAGAMAVIYAQNGLASIHLYIATALGVGFAMMLTGALMSLVFLSNGTGHDAAIEDRLGEERERHEDGRRR